MGFLGGQNITGLEIAFGISVNQGCLWSEPSITAGKCWECETARSQCYETIKAVKNVRLPVWSWWPQAVEHGGGDEKVGVGMLIWVVYPSLGEKWVCVLDTHHVGEILLSV